VVNVSFPPARPGALAALALLLAAAGCGERRSSQADAAPGGIRAVAAPEPVVLKEAWLTTRDTMDNIDSPAVWHGPDGQHWLLATAKTTHVLVVNDAATGKLIRRVGGPGKALGRLQRPNGIAVIDDLVLVVERDNHRVQVFRLPSFRPVGVFGDTLLTLPYGLTVYRDGEPGRYVVYVTDNYEMPDETVPPDSLLGRRVRQFKVSVAGHRLSAEQVRAFGETSGPGVLRVVESIEADVPNDRLLIAEEQEGASLIKVYSLDGKFTGTTVGPGLFPHQAEGIILYACGDTAGYWVTTDQDLAVNTFHVFDRRSLELVGSFRGETTLNTDGIALTQRGFGGFAHGAFYAVHNDGNVAAFGWSEIADALKLRKDCAVPAPTAEAAS
jgi:3-phytase